jgi:hypothetical protein
LPIVDFHAFGANAPVRHGFQPKAACEGMRPHRLITAVANQSAPETPMRVRLAQSPAAMRSFP